MINKIEIPEGLISDAEHWPSLQSVKDWDELVAQIEAVNKEIENAVVVYDDKDFKGVWRTDLPTYLCKTKALLVNIDPIKKKTKEERAMELIESLAESLPCSELQSFTDPERSAIAARLYNNARLKAKAILEESEGT